MIKLKCRMEEQEDPEEEEEEQQIAPQYYLYIQGYNNGSPDALPESGTQSQEALSEIFTG